MERSGSQPPVAPESPPQQVLPPGARCCVVGGGLCGLYACKALRDAGLQPVVFEQGSESEGAGGVWRQKGKGGAAYDSLCSNNSARIFETSDFSFAWGPGVDFPTHAEIRRYAAEYVAHFGLQAHLRFSHTVVGVKPLLVVGDGGGARSNPAQLPAWEVTTRNDVTGAAKRHEFAACFLCTGQFGGDHVNLPEFMRAGPDGNGTGIMGGAGSGCAGFEGRLMHSVDYRSPAQAGAIGRHVTVVGMGNSALDIALECAQEGAASVSIACRHGSLLVPMVDASGRPGDVLFLTRFNQAPADVDRRGRPRVGLDGLPIGLDTTGNQTQMMNDELNEAFVAAGMPRPDGDRNRGYLGAVKDPEGYLEVLRRGRVRLGPMVARATGRSVTLTDGSERPCDLIVAATGYDLFGRLGFVADEVMAPVRRWVAGAGASRPWLRLHRQCMHPRFRNLAFCGMVAGGAATEAGIGEMQARWAAAVLTGRAAWPWDEEVEAELARRAQFLEKAQPFFPNFVRYVQYMDELAAACGAMPDVPPPVFPEDRPGEAERLAEAIWHGPAVQAQWRLRGHGAWAGAADRVIEAHAEVASRGRAARL